MAQGKNAVERAAPTYTLAGDFCRIFAEDMSSLYRLAFLLTGDGGQAESCFSSALEDCMNSGVVFKEWAHSWARRAVIQNAIKMVRPAPELESRTFRNADDPGSSDPLTAITVLPPFQRFVFVMTVLERYSDQDCRVLLGHTRQDVIGARSEAIERLAAVQGEQIAAGEGSNNRNDERRFRHVPVVVTLGKKQSAELPGEVTQAMTA